MNSHTIIRAKAQLVEFLRTAGTTKPTTTEAIHYLQLQGYSVNSEVLHVLMFGSSQQWCVVDEHTQEISLLENEA